MSDRRLVRVYITPDLLANLVIGSPPGFYFRVKSGLPADAKPVGHSYDIERDQFVVMYEHESFAIVPPAYRIPEFEPYGIRIESLRLSNPVTDLEIEFLRKEVAGQHEDAGEPSIVLP